MSVDGNSNGVPSKESQTDVSARHGVNKKNSEKTMRQKANYATPPELQRNEAAARGTPVAERLTQNKTNGSGDKSHVNEEEDDPCVKKHKERSVDEGGLKSHTFRATPGPDPRYVVYNHGQRSFNRCIGTTIFLRRRWLNFFRTLKSNKPNEFPDPSSKNHMQKVFNNLGNLGVKKKFIHVTNMVFFFVCHADKRAKSRSVISERQTD